MLALIDNYDSFTYNLVQYFGELGAEIKVFRNDQVTLDELIASNLITWSSPPVRVNLSRTTASPQTRSNTSMAKSLYWESALAINAWARSSAAK